LEFRRHFQAFTQGIFLATDFRRESQIIYEILPTNLL
jgi:hypothetical protein